MNETNMCKNKECEKRYQCQRYCTESTANYNVVPDLKSLCNKDSGYKKFVHWRKTNE